MSVRSQTFVTQNVNTLIIFQKRTAQRHFLREQLIDRLYPTPAIRNPYTGSQNQAERQIQALNDLAGSFSRYAGSQQTAFDSGSSRSSSSADADQMKRQVERAINQVLGGATGRNADSFINALNATFPASSTSEGKQVVFSPSRGMVSLYSPNAPASDGYSNGTNAASSVGQISARQAALYRQASIVASDALKVLAGINPFVPEAIGEQVEGLRSQIGSEIDVIYREFSRVEEPRPELVRAYFDELTLHLDEFGRRAFLNDPTIVATSEDEAQVAGFELLKNYARTMRKAWDAYYKGDRQRAFLSLSERIDRAYILLPILAQANNDFEAAMDSVDFTEADRRSLAAKFNVLKDPKSTIQYTIAGNNTSVRIRLRKPDMTVYDLTEWLDRYSTVDAQKSLALSGQYGLDFTADQADTLFWVIAPVVAHLKTTSTPISSGGTTLEQVLSNERVDWALNNVLSQLDALAQLDVPGGEKNPLVL
jgi:hypothetical protein